MSQQELLKRVVRVLEDAGIEYMATGSIVSSIQGEPRSSHDVDLVVAIAPVSAPLLVREFPPPNFYLDEQAVREAIARRGMFNLLDVANGDKVDFWVLTDEPFDCERFARRQKEKVSGEDVFISRPEDTILQKLHWIEQFGASEKQFTDALRVYEVQFAHLNVAYMERWAKQLGIDAWWERLKSEADPL